jgi:hypothetical protein
MNKTSAGANQNWVIILNENFESGFPQTNHWTLLWSSLAPYSWDDVNFNPHSSAHSAWCAGGRQSTQVPNLNPANDNYPNDLDAWMIWGPFNLQDATDAELQFWYWNDSEQDFDFFSVGGSIDNNEYFFPVEISGNSNGWQFMSFNLNSLSGQPQVWIAFNFLSDEIENAKGAFVDDIVLRKMTANTAPTITHQPVTAGKSGTELPITATISDNEAITAKLFYRPGGASTYKNITMTANANTFTGVIPATEVTSRGLEYYMTIGEINFCLHLNENTRIRIPSDGHWHGANSTDSALAIFVPKVPWLFYLYGCASDKPAGVHWSVQRWLAGGKFGGARSPTSCGPVMPLLC